MTGRVRHSHGRDREVARASPDADLVPVGDLPEPVALQLRPAADRPERLLVELEV